MKGVRLHDDDRVKVHDNNCEQMRDDDDVVMICSDDDQQKSKDEQLTTPSLARVMTITKDISQRATLNNDDGSRGH